MKKGALLLVILLAICSAAFAQQYENMSISMTYKGVKTKLYVIDVNGKVEERKLKSISNGFGVSADKVAFIQADVQEIINELGADGWKLENVSNMNTGGFIMVNYYLIREKK